MAGNPKVGWLTTAVVDGDPRETVHAATVDLQPREGLVVPQTDEDSTTYARPVEADTDWTPVALAGGAVLAEARPVPGRPPS